MTRLLATLALLASSVAALADPLEKRHVYLLWDDDPCTSVVVGMHMVGKARPLLARGATWRYLDRTPPAGWQRPDFDDSAWRQGAAPLGYGDRDIRTTLSYGDDPRAKRPAAYFRLTFDARRPTGDLALDLVADDGAVVYLNGAEVARLRLPEGALTATTLATDSAPGDGRGGARIAIDRHQLREGRNVLAVAVHQRRPDSSDLAFDLALTTSSGAPNGPLEVRWTRADAPAARTAPARWTQVATARVGAILGLPDRRVAHAKLTGLTPGTRYRFVAGSEALGWSAVRAFRTIPREGLLTKEPLRFAVGGDMGTSRAMVDLLIAAAKRSPHFCIVGGDLAYANGRLERADRWDAWLDAWCAEMVTPDGLTIPMVAAIGNHETNGRRGSLRRRAPFYYPLFADGQGGKSYFVHDFGKALRLVVLDTGHTVSHAAQGKFLDRALAGAVKGGFRWRMAAYHVPLYPGHRNPIVGLPGRITWLPLFDRYRLHAAFEHHDHTMKRTRMLRGGKVVESGGTVYLGDGCFGKGERPASQRWYTAYAAARQHVWVVELDGEQWRAEALGTQGQGLDRYASPKGE